MSATSTPHDALVRALLADRRFAAQILRVALPAEIAALIDADRLELLEGSFVDPSLNRSQSDALFRLPLLTGPVRVLYVLIEHKSRPDPGIALQLLGYQANILRAIASAGTPLHALPEIEMLVFYNGSEPWTVPHTLLAGLVRFTLFDLNAVDILSLPIDDTPKAVLLALKHARHPGDPEPWLRQVFARLPENTLWESRVLTYILATVDTTRDIVLRAARAAQPNRWGTSMPTVAERLIEEGKQIGLIEGIALGEARGEARGRKIGLTEGEARGVALGEARGRIAAIARVLATRFGPLDAGVMLRLQALPFAALDTLLDRAVTADSLDAVFAPNARH